MKCIVGLGNIGKEYDNTRHNTGFICLDKVAEKYNVKFDKKLQKCIYGEACVGGEKVILVKPTTYMNLSGQAVCEIVNWFKIALEDVLVIYDDVDLQFGKIRYRETGSAGTHNGMRNIITVCSSQDIKRVRVGMESRDTGSKIGLYDYVLSKYTSEELYMLKTEIAENVIDIIEVSFIKVGKKDAV